MSAARYVGRIGGLAVALGIGAAVTVGGGVAHADDPADKKQSEGTETSTNPDADVAAPDSSTALGSSGVKTRKPSLLDIPKMVLGVAGAAINHEPGALPRGLVRPPRPTATPDDEDDTRVVTTKRTQKPKDRAPRPEAEVDDSASAPSPDASINVAMSSRSVENDPKPRVLDVPATFAPPSIASFAAPALTARTQVAPTQPQPRLASPVAMVVSNVLHALGFSPTAATTGGAPRAPMPFVLGTLQLISRELERNLADRKANLAAFTTSLPVDQDVADAPPAPGDEVQTPYGKVGKWMLQSNGEIANYGGLEHDGKEVLEPVNVIIIDDKSKTPQEAEARLNKAMFFAGFPAQPIHSGGFQGEIDDVKYGQQPSFPLLGYSDNLFIVDNNHGRIFGPDPEQLPGGNGYVWSGAFSRETLALNNGLPTHGYVSSNVARNALAMRLIMSGQAEFVGFQKMDNAYNTGDTTTGDHDGYAVVLRLK